LDPARIIVAACALGSAATSAAFGDPRLDEKVYSPYVQNRIAELELRRGQEVGGPLGGERTDVIETEYGLNDRLSLALVANIERAPNETSHMTGLGLEGVVYLGQVPKLGVDIGLYLEYTAGLHGEDDRTEAKLLLAQNVGRFQGLFNVILERPIGAAEGQGFASYGYAASATWRTIGALRLGAEAFGDLGSDHGFLTGPEGAYIGPQLLWVVRPALSPFEIEIDAGWLASAGADQGEADSQARLTIEFERRM
jgi:hypothetical protein